MLKKSLILLTIASTMYAGTQEDSDKFASNLHKKSKRTKSVQNNLKIEKYQILSDKIDSKIDIITATGKVLIISKTYYMTANKVIYDKKNETFELFGNVVILKDNIHQTVSEYTFIDMKNDKLKQDPTLIINKKSLLWINSTKTDADKNKVNLESSILSSCNCEEPDWSIKFSSGEYDTQRQWVETFNNRVYIGSTPVFYLPYFAFPTDNTRRTGVLIPTIGHSSTDGFIYKQPIFIAPQDNYDIELVPQIRGKRGEGLYAYLRYADTEDSVLNISSGFFNEKNSYYESNNLENKTHTGFAAEYKNRGIFAKDIDSQDGLYVDLDWISDVEYKNLEDKSGSDSYDKKIESKINYFYNTPNYYTGLYFTYYLDTSIDSNVETMQEIPQAQFHTYSKPVFFDKLLYSTDTKITNHTRPEGINARLLDSSLSLFYNQPLWNDYLNFTIKNETALSLLDYYNSDTDFDNGTFIENKTTLTLGTNLLKPYDDYIHTLDFNVDFTLPTTLVDNGDLDNITNSDSELDIFPVNETQKTLSLSLNHSLYDKEDLSQIINHKIKQSILYNNGNTKLSDLENEVTFNYILGYVRNRIIYSQEDDTITESSTGFSIGYDDYFFNATHYKSKETENSGKEDLESVTLKVGSKFYNDYSLSYVQNYNIEEDLRTKEALVLDINDRCWTFNLSVEKEVIASDSNNSNNIEQDSIYFTLVLKQLGGINFTR